jgi:hypothetical protein
LTAVSGVADWADRSTDEFLSPKLIHISIHIFLLTLKNTIVQWKTVE